MVHFSLSQVLNFEAGVCWKTMGNDVFWRNFRPRNINKNKTKSCIKLISILVWLFGRFRQSQAVFEHKYHDLLHYIYDSILFPTVILKFYRGYWSYLCLNFFNEELKVELSSESAHYLFVNHLNLYLTLWCKKVKKLLLLLNDRLPFTIFLLLSFKCML